MQENSLLFSVTNPVWRWGDGFFETGKWHSNRWHLKAYHLQRIKNSIATLGWNHYPSEAHISEAVAKTVHANGLTSARIRISFWSEGDRETNFCVTAEALTTQALQMNETGWRLTICHDVQKDHDALSALKSTSYQRYLYARRSAEKSGYDEAIILNAAGNICEGSYTNIFIFKDGVWVTPPLTEGPVAGVCRAYILATAHEHNVAVKEEKLSVKNLFAAEEIICTNAVLGLRWVQSFGDKLYVNSAARKLYAALFEPK